MRLRTAVPAFACSVVALVQVGCGADDGGGGDPSKPQTRISLVGPKLLALGLDKQSPTKTSYWDRYEDRDSPEGAFMGWMQPGADSVEGRLALGRTIKPGTYHVFLKARHYNHPIGVRLSLGGGEASVRTTKDEDKDDNGYWTKPIEVTVDKDTSELGLQLSRVDDAEEKEKLLLRGVYVTSDPADVVLETDRVVSLAVPKDLDRSAARPGNVIADGSFETGVGHGWGSRDDRRFSIPSLWDPQTGKDGAASMRVSLDPADNASGKTAAEKVTVVSKPYSVAPNKQHTLSMWVKSEDGEAIKGEMALVNAFKPPEDKEREQTLSQSFSVAGEWTRVDLTGDLVAYPTADYSISISSKLASGRHLWIDGVSLNEGGPAAYAAKEPLELGIERTEPSNLYYDDAPVRLRLRAYNSTPAALRRTVRYEVYDYLNRRVRAGSKQVSVAAGSVQTDDLDLSLGRRGIFRLVMWVQGEDGSEEEVVYGVVPRPRNEGLDSGSAAGTHSNFTDFQFDAMARMGIKWDRGMSPGSFFRWADVEREEGKITWYDAEVDRAKKRGVSVVGTLGFNDEWPEFAKDGELPNLDKWQRYVEQLVEHYKGRVRAWEVWNEPNYTFEPSFYAKLLKRAADAIKGADPAASVVAIGGAYQPAFVKDVFDELKTQFPDWKWREHLDVISMHMYPARSEIEPSAGSRAAGFREQVVPTYKLPVWNTESGEWDTGFYRTTNAVRPRWGTSLFELGDAAEFAASSPQAVQSLSQTFLETIGNGLDKYFYYDFRIQASPTYVEDSPTMLEYDDTIRPKGIAYAVLAHLFDHSTGLGRIGLSDSASQAYLFKRGDVALVGLYGSDARPRTIRPAGIGADKIKVYDAMGNPVALRDGQIHYGATPVYIEGSGISADALREAFGKGTVAVRKDSQAPAPSIDEGPRGPVDKTGVHVRWSATDDVSVPSTDNPSAITYSHRLTGRDGEDEWSGWTLRDTADYADLPGGTYTLQVRARDAAGNTSGVVSRPVEVR